MLSYWKAYWRLYFALRYSLLTGNFQLEALVDFFCKPYHNSEMLAEISRLARDKQAYTIGGRNASFSPVY